MTTRQETAFQSDSSVDLWSEYLQTRTESLRNQLMVQYQYVVRTVAQRIVRKLPHQVDVDDLIQCGMLGLRDAIHSFDLKRKVKFETYCIRRIRGSIFDGLRSLTWAPRDVRKSIAELQRAAEEVQMQLGHSPSAEEVSCRMGISVEQYHKMARQASRVTQLSMNQTLPGQTHAIEFEDQVEPRPEEIAQRSDIKELLTHQLSHNERLILVLYYYEHLTMREIGEVLNITESRVSQMHTQILSLLKTRFEPRLNETAGAKGITVNL